MKKIILLFQIFILTILYAAPIPAPPEAQQEMWVKYNALILDSQDTVEALTQSQRKKLLQLVSNNKVAKLSALQIYDPPQNGQPRGEIGYCYGRAMAAHLIARKMGLKEASIKKIFAAGDMQNGSVRWRFHMATLVWGAEGNYYAIDPIMPGMIGDYNEKHGTAYDPKDPLTPDLWIKIIKENYDNTEKILEKYPELSTHPKFTGTIKFYIASPEAVMVDMRRVPATLQVETGEWINEILFDPMSLGGFTPVYQAPEEHPLYFTVDTEDNLRKYFMIQDEPQEDQFNFFILIAKLFFSEEQIIQRTYLYNGKLSGTGDFQHYTLGYFPSLVKSVETLTEKFERN